MRRRIVWLSFILAAVPSAAHANPGAPLFAAGFTHLVFLNLLIGLGEGLIVALIFKIKAGTAVTYMIAANYFSTLVGFLAFAPLMALAWLILKSATIYNLWLLIWAYIAALYLLAVVLEWPFCFRALRLSRPTGSRILGISLLASFVAQTASYAVLIPYYEHASVYHVYKDFTVDRDLSFAKPATVYFLREDGVYKVKTDGSALRKLLDTRAVGKLYDLSVYGNATSKYLELSMATDRASELTISNHFAPTPLESTGWHDGGLSWFAQHPMALDLRPYPHSKWNARALESGVSMEEYGSWDGIWIALRLPFFQWNGRSVTMLPGDQVVAELSGQIVILDAKSRKMGLIAMGRNPVATPADDKVIDADIRQAANALSKEVGDDTKRIRREAADGKDP
jgi:hypothetical protein